MRVSGISWLKAVWLLSVAALCGVACGNTTATRPQAPPSARATPFKLPARPGDSVPSVPLVDLISTRTVTLGEFKGQVVLADFWATFCPGCLPVLDGYGELLRRKAGTWQGRVTIVAVSMDRKQDAALAFVGTRDWKSIRHLWSPMDAEGRENVSFRGFGVIDMPLALLVDRNGVIVWRGNPARHDVEKQIDKLLGQGE